MKSPSFKAELEEYKEWVATWSLAPVDQWQQKLALVVIDNWRKSASVESIWTKLTTELQPDDLWRPKEFITLVLQRRFLAEQVLQSVKEAPKVESAIDRQWKRHWRDGKYFVAAGERTELDKFLVQKKRVLGRDQVAAASKLFIKGWSEKFMALCGKPLDEVVRVMTEVAFGGKSTIPSARGARRATSREGRRPNPDYA
jgi:hypothetical protein